MSYADQLALFWHYLLLTTVAAGGVSTVIPDMQRYVVEVHPWMSAQTFGEVFALVQVAPSRGRLAISYLTLFGAFASSVFWTIGHYLNQWGGWRQTLLAFALFNLAVCVPLNWVGLARRRDSPSGVDGAAPPKTPSPDGPALTGRARDNGVVLFALAGIAGGAGALVHKITSGQ